MSDYNFRVRKNRNGTWEVDLPHQCDEWDIAFGDHEGCIQSLSDFIAEAEDALDSLIHGHEYGEHP